MTPATTEKLSAKDFKSDQQVRWCPGCGDYAILNSMQAVMADLGLPRENHVIISGIGCAARFPYYVDTYGFHTIHGRAPAIASGLKIARPELTVWVVGGDGDMLSIGGNHLLHALRRNVDIKILCFNNRIYGLTKGQYSPTSEVGKRTKTTPMGSLDRPVNPISLALSAEASLVTRSVDIFNSHLRETLKVAAAHKGSSFMEILQNCVIFNDGTFSNVTDRDRRDDNTLFLEHGERLLFGKEKDKGLRLNGLTLGVVTPGQDGVTEDDVLVYDETDRALAFLLSRMDPARFPTPVGTFYREQGVASYETGVEDQLEGAKEKSGAGDLMKLVRRGDIWTVNE